jgi:hypothetical protein
MWGFTLYSDDSRIWDLPITEVSISEKDSQNMRGNTKNFLDFMKEFRSRFFGNCFKD